jgi:hypothetical protein
MTSDTLIEKEIGPYLCETVDVSEYDQIHIDSNGETVDLYGWKNDE